jgi:hypothetical protein
VSCRRLRSRRCTNGSKSCWRSDTGYLSSTVQRSQGQRERERQACEDTHTERERSKRTVTRAVSGRRGQQWSAWSAQRTRLRGRRCLNRRALLPPPAPSSPTPSGTRHTHTHARVGETQTHSISASLPPLSHTLSDTHTRTHAVREIVCVCVCDVPHTWWRHRR